MYFIRFLWTCFRGLLRLLSTWKTLFRCIPSSSRLSLPYTDLNMESDEECQYDSTWEDETQKERNITNKKMYRQRSRRNIYAAKDMQEFRHRCPKTKDDKDEVGYRGNENYPNLNFYRGLMRSLPDGIYIDDFHRHWKGDYDRLEEVHSYIQWLFPLQEPGVNWRAEELKINEIKLFRKDEQAKQKLVKSYEMMLDFYGIHLLDKSTGEVDRAFKWKERFWNLNRNSHNNLRITRILKCLGTLGLQHYQAPLVKFFLRETLINKELPRVKQSVLDYFMFAVLDKSKRRELVRFAYEHFEPREDFVWGPKKILSQRHSVSKRVREQKDERVGDKHCNNAEPMQTDQMKTARRSFNRHHSLDDIVGSPNHQTEKGSCRSQDRIPRSKSFDHTTYKNQRGSPQELTHSNKGTNKDGSIKTRV